MKFKNLMYPVAIASLVTIAFACKKDSSSSSTNTNTTTMVGLTAEKSTTDALLDDDADAERLRQRLRQRARDDIRGAAGRRWDHDVNGPVGIAVLRARRPREGQERRHTHRRDPPHDAAPGAERRGIILGETARSPVKSLRANGGLLYEP